MGGTARGVRASSESSIEITFFYRGERCRERIKLVPTPANLRWAARHKAAVEDAIAKGTFDYTVTFPDSPRAEKYAKHKGDVLYVEKYLTDWLEAQKAILRSSSYDNYRKDVENLFIPRFGTLRLSEWRIPQFRQLCKSLTCGNKRISNIVSVARHALQDAVDDELIETNPLVGWKFKKKDIIKEEDDIDPFDANEQSQILAQLTGGYRNLIQFAFWSGVRTSELIALQWKDVDWKAGVIKVRRAKTANAAEPEIPKTSAGRRDIKLLPMALEALQRQRADTQFHPSGYIFINPKQNVPWKNDQQIRKNIWIPALQKAKVRYRYPYQTRHTYASMMLSAGEQPMWVANQMGHADVQMIFRNYGRWLPGANATAGEKAAQAYAHRRA